MDRLVSVLLPDGNRITKSIAATETVEQLMDAVSIDPAFPFAREDVQLFYLDRLLSPSDIIGEVSNDNEYTIQCVQPNGEEAAASDDMIRGFDRLERIGYTADEIREVRDLFHSVRRTAQLSRQQQLDLEDEWVPALTMFNGAAEALRALEVEAPRARSTAIQINRVELIRPETESAETPLLSQSEEPEEGRKKSWWPFAIGFVLGLSTGFMDFLGPMILLSTLCVDKSSFIGVLFGMGLCFVLQ